MSSAVSTIQTGATVVARADAGLARSTATVTRRALLRYVRTPQLIVMATVQMSLFFLIYRYLFSGAVRPVGVPYVDYLAPGFIATGVLFSGIGAAAGADGLMAAMQSVQAAGVEIDDISMRQPNLDEVFLALTGRSDG